MLDSRNAPVNVYLSAGSNIDPERNLRLACDVLEAEYGELTLSPVYQNSAVGFEGEDFLNMVIAFSSTDAPDRIVDCLEHVHELAERVRQENPYSPRTLDLDLLLYGDAVSNQPHLPHDDIDKYGFVIKPLADVAPGSAGLGSWASVGGSPLALAPPDHRQPSHGAE